MLFKKFCLIAATFALSASASFASTVNDTSNVVFIVDESGSMGGEHTFLKTVVADLDAALLAAGVTNRSYGVVGFGGGGAGNLGRTLGSGLTNALGAVANLSTLGLGGYREDGYSGINYALTAFNYTAGAAINYILVTDEDRDDENSALTTASIQQSLTNSKILLNAVINNPFGSDDGAALGIDSSNEAYIADGAGGFSLSDNGTIGNGYGATETDYAALALATGGAAWDLNQLRAGGSTAASFTEAFIDIKVQEIISQPPSGVPLPGAAWMLLAGMGGLGAMRRRKKAA